MDKETRSVYSERLYHGSAPAGLCHKVDHSFSAPPTNWFVQVANKEKPGS